jgi:hypothetical protein
LWRRDLPTPPVGATPRIAHIYLPIDTRLRAGSGRLIAVDFDTDDDGYPTPEDAALTGWTSTPGVNAHVLSVTMWAVIALVVVACASCSSGSKRTGESAASALHAAARQTLAISSADVHGDMTVDDSPEVALTGTVDFAHRRAAIRVAPAIEGASWPTFEVRYVDGWSYIQIDPGVRRPPTVSPKAQWIAYRGRPPRVVPVPDITIPPAFPVEAVQWVLDLHVADARFVDSASTDPRRVAARFAEASHRGTDYTYSIDRRGRIVAVSTDKDHGGDNLTYVYTDRPVPIVAPTDHVQRVPSGAELYPTTTTTSDA